MRKTLFLLLLLFYAPTVDGYQFWNDLRHSALLPDGTVTIRAENPTGGGVSNHLLFSDGGIVEELMTSTADGPSTVTAAVPGPVASTRYYGFRLLRGDELDFMPVRIPDGSDPLPTDLTRVDTDVVGDEMFGFTNLDLTDCRASFSGTRLYASLTNAGGGFPVNQGLTFFGYLIGLADPANADPDTVFGLMYTIEQGTLISPGLYKITGTGMDDLEKIGEILIEEHPAENTLMLSCELTDLLSDPDFLDFYDPSDPSVGVGGFTQKITLLGGAAEADRIAGGRCYLREFSIEPGANALPEIRDLRIEGTGGGAYVQIEYEDPDGNCPVLSEIVFDGFEQVPIYPTTLDYSTAVLYRTEEGIEPLASGNWDLAVARFSDNQTDLIEQSITPVAVEEPASGHGATLGVRAAPNPFTGEVSFLIDISPDESARLRIYDPKGRTVAHFALRAQDRRGVALRWDGRDQGGDRLPTGAYFYRLVTNHGEVSSGLRLVR